MVKTLPYPEAISILKLPGSERNLFSSPQWLEVLLRTHKLKLFVKYIEKDGDISSYIIYSVVDNFLEQKICICSYCDYFDCYINSADDWQMFFESLREEYPSYRIAIRNLRDQLVKECANFKVIGQERFHMLDVRESLDVLWKKTDSSFRAAVKQGQRANTTVRIGNKDDFRSFYKLHLMLRKNKYRLFPQPYKFFDIIWDVFMERGNGFLLGAYNQEGRLIAGTVYLICGNTLYYKFNTSDARFLKHRPNNLLFWEGIKQAKQRGLEYIDLGSSGCDQKGLILFKEHTGATSPCNITHLGFNPPNYKFSRKIILKTFTRICTLPFMPECVIRAGSRIIYSYLA